MVLSGKETFFFFFGSVVSSGKLVVCVTCSGINLVRDRLFFSLDMCPPLGYVPPAPRSRWVGLGWLVGWFFFFFASLIGKDMCACDWVRDDDDNAGAQPAATNSCI